MEAERDERGKSNYLGKSRLDVPMSSGRLADQRGGGRRIGEPPQEPAVRSRKCQIGKDWKHTIDSPIGSALFVKISKLENSKLEKFETFKLESKYFEVVSSPFRARLEHET